MSKSEVERERRTETALPARGLSGLQAAEQWQEMCMELFPASGHACPLSRVSWPCAALRSTETSLSVGRSGGALMDVH